MVRHDSAEGAVGSVPPYRRAACVLIVAGPLAVFAAALLLPVCWVAAHGWTLTGLYEESIGYRYFYSLRVVYGGEYTFLPQGQLVDVVYQWLQRLLTVGGYHPTKLFPRIDVFAYVAVACAHLTAVACFAWAVGPMSTLAGRLFAVPFWLAAYYGMGGPGAYVLLQPDYHQWILPIGLLTAGILSRWAELLSRWSLHHSIALGVLLGAAAAVKATLVVFPGSIALSWILAKRPWRRSLALGGLSVAIGVVAWLAILLAASQGRADLLSRLLRDLVTFAESTGPAESYAGWTWTVVTEAPLLVKLSAVLPALIVGSGFLARTRSEFGAVAGLAAGAALYHAFLYWRFVSATWFEAAVFLQLTVWSAASMLGRGRLPAGGAAIGMLAMALALLVSGGPALADYLRRIERIHGAGHELSRLISGHPGRIAFLIPDNVLRPFTVDAAIAKGMSNILDEGVSPLIRRMVPERQYLLGVPRYSPAYYRRHPVDVSEFSALVFVVPLKDGRSKSDQLRELEAYYSVSLILFDCARDVDFSEVEQSITVCLRREAVLEDREAMAVLHARAGTKVSVGELVSDASGRRARLREGDVVLSGPSGQLMRIEKGGGVVRLTAEDHRRIRVVNIGQWDLERRAYRGLAADYVDGRWVVQSAAVLPANANARFEEGDEGTPIPGFWISPAGAGYTISRLRDDHGTFVRVRATTESPYLVINGGSPLSTLDNVPVTVRGQIRARSKGTMALTLYDVSGPGRVESSSEQTEALGAWQTLLLQRQRVTYPASGDNFSVGLIGARTGDWFDVRELSLFVGMLP